MNVKLQKWGNSHGIRLSKEVLEKLGLLDMLDNINFELILEDNEIRLKPIVELSPYARLFENYDFNKPRATFQWDEPVGKEI